jgi:hypothetical protein
MDSREWVETGSVSEQAQVEDSSAQVEAVKVVEMGDVSVETKGTIHGLELGYTPRSF